MRRKKRLEKRRDTLIAFPQILATRGGNAKRQTGPEEGRDESRGGQRKIRDGNGVILQREGVTANIPFLLIKSFFCLQLSPE